MSRTGGATGPSRRLCGPISGGAGDRGVMPASSGARRSAPARLVQVFEIIGKSPRARTCEAMQGITSEMEENLEDFGGTDAADQVLIGCAQAVEHYEIARYGLLKTWAEKLGYTDAVPLLEKTLEEEKATDALLSQIAGSLSYGEAEKPAARRKSA